MQLILALAVLAALVIAENGPNAPVEGAGYRFLAATLGMGLVGLFGALIAGSVARQLERDFDGRATALRRFRRLRWVHMGLWLAVAGGILYGLQWGQMVRFNWRLNRVVLLDEILILVPLMLPMVLSWAAFYEVDRALRNGLDPVDAADPSLPTRGRYVLVQVRHVLGVLLLPVLLVVAVQDVAELIAPGVLQSDEALLVYAVPFLLLLALFPVMLRYVWETRPLAAGPLRAKLEAAGRRANFRCGQILVWQTNGMMVNAAVAGFVPALRYVFLTDALLSQLSDGEIEAVFGHEVGHVRHRHLLLRIATMAMPVSLWLLVEQLVPQASQQVEHWLASGGLGRQAPVGLVMLAAMGGYVGLVFGAFSRLLEYQADLFGCRIFGQEEGGESVAMMASALERLAYLSGIDRRWSGWQHASIARRVDFLRRAASDPAYERRFHRRVRTLGLVIIVALLSPLVVGLAQSVRF